MDDVSYEELKRGFGFLVIKLMDMELKTDDGHEICPMFGFCEDCDDCFLDRVMEGKIESIPDNVLTPLKSEWEEFTRQIVIHLNIVDTPDEEYYHTCCDGSFKLTRNIIETRFPEFDIEATIAYFKKSEWFCDCDIFSESPIYLGESIVKQGELNATTERSN